MNPTLISRLSFLLRFYRFSTLTAGWAGLSSWLVYVFSALCMTGLISQLFAECRAGSTSSLCVDHPREIASVIWPIATALLIKGALTIITFGIKLPGKLV
jgi:hypothetical protein